MVEKVVIEVSGKENLDSTIDSVEKLGAVDKKNAEQFKKSNSEFQKQQKSTQDSLKKTGGVAASVGENIKNQFAGLGATIAGAFAVQAVIQFGKDSIKSFLEAEKGAKTLFNALGKNEKVYNSLIEQASELQEKTIFSDDAIIAAQNFLAANGLNEKQIRKTIEAAVQLSTVTGQDLQTATTTLAGTYEGAIGRLGKLDSGFKTLTLTQLQNGAAVDLIAEKYAGFAEAQLETTSGKLENLANKWDDIKEIIGEGLVNAGYGLLGTFDALTLGAFDLTSANFALEESENSVENAFVKTREEGEKLSKTVIQGIISLQEFQLAQLNGGAGSDELRESIQKLKDSIADVVPEAKTYGETLNDIRQRISDLKDAQGALSPNTKELTQNIKDIEFWQRKLDEAIGKTTDKIKEQKKEMETNPTEMWEQMAEGRNAELRAEQKAEEESTALAQSGADEAVRIKKEETEERLRLDDILAENEKKNQDEVTAKLEEEARKRERIQAALISATSQLITMAIDYQLSLSRQATDYELSLLQEQFDKRTISEEQYNSKRRAILKDQAEKEKEAAIIKATIDTANAVISAFADGGPVMAALAAAVGIAQLAVISATPIPEFEKGGRIKGKRHREGGTIIEAEDGEFVINRKASKRIGFDNLEMLNKGIVPVKMLKQGLSQQREKSFANNLMMALGSNSFDTYPIEKELRKGRKHDTELTKLLIKHISTTGTKRGGYK